MTSVDSGHAIKREIYRLERRRRLAKVEASNYPHSRRRLIADLYSCCCHWSIILVTTVLNDPRRSDRRIRPYTGGLVCLEQRCSHHDDGAENSRGLLGEKGSDTSWKLVCQYGVACEWK
jgi:hypothetical protein